MMRVLYRDAFLAVVDKPAGLLSVPARDLTRQHALGQLKAALADIQPVAAPVFASFGALSLESRSEAEPLALHRLDQATGGLLVVPLHPAVLSSLARSLATRTSEKEYEAVVDTRHLPPASPLRHTDAGTIDTPLGPNSHVPLVQEASGSQLRPAVTDWQVLQRGSGAARLLLQPRTGRTHQLRLHCALPPPLGLGAPILGCNFYSNPDLLPPGSSYLAEVTGSGKYAATSVAALLQAQLASQVAAVHTPAFPSLHGCTALEHAKQLGCVPRLLLHARAIAFPDFLHGSRDAASGVLQERARRGLPASFTEETDYDTLSGSWASQADFVIQSRLARRVLSARKQKPGAEGSLVRMVRFRLAAPF